MEKELRPVRSIQTGFKFGSGVLSQQGKVTKNIIQNTEKGVKEALKYSDGNWLRRVFAFSRDDLIYKVPLIQAGIIAYYLLHPDESFVADTSHYYDIVKSSMINKAEMDYSIQQTQGQLLVGLGGTLIGAFAGPVRIIGFVASSAGLLRQYYAVQEFQTAAQQEMVVRVAGNILAYGGVAGALGYVANPASVAIAAGSVLTAEVFDLQNTPFVQYLGGQLDARFGTYVAESSILPKDFEIVIKGDNIDVIGGSDNHTILRFNGFGRALSKPIIRNSGKLTELDVAGTIEKRGTSIESLINNNKNEFIIALRDLSNQQNEEPEETVSDNDIVNSARSFWNDITGGNRPSPNNLGRLLQAMDGTDFEKTYSESLIQSMKDHIGGRGRQINEVQYSKLLKTSERYLQLKSISKDVAGLFATEYANGAGDFEVNIGDVTFPVRLDNITSAGVVKKENTSKTVAFRIGFGESFTDYSQTSTSFVVIASTNDSDKLENVSVHNLGDGQEMLNHLYTHDGNNRVEIPSITVEEGLSADSFSEIEDSTGISGSVLFESMQAQWSIMPWEVLSHHAPFYPFEFGAQSSYSQTQLEEKASSDDAKTIFESVSQATAPLTTITLSTFWNSDIVKGVIYENSNSPSVTILSPGVIIEGTNFNEQAVAASVVDPVQDAFLYANLGIDRESWLKKVMTAILTMFVGPTLYALKVDTKKDQELRPRDFVEFLRDTVKEDVYVLETQTTKEDLIRKFNDYKGTEKYDSLIEGSQSKEKFAQFIKDIKNGKIYSPSIQKTVAFRNKSRFENFKEYINRSFEEKICYYTKSFIDVDKPYIYSGKYYYHPASYYHIAICENPGEFDRVEIDKINKIRGPKIFASDEWKDNLVELVRRKIPELKQFEDISEWGLKNHRDFARVMEIDLEASGGRSMMWALWKTVAAKVPQITVKNIILATAVLSLYFFITKYGWILSSLMPASGVISNTSSMIIPSREPVQVFGDTLNLSIPQNVEQRLVPGKPINTTPRFNLVISPSTEKWVDCSTNDKNNQEMIISVLGKERDRAKLDLTNKNNYRFPINNTFDEYIRGGYVMKTDSGFVFANGPNILQTGVVLGKERCIIASPNVQDKFNSGVANDIIHFQESGRETLASNLEKIQAFIKGKLGEIKLLNETLSFEDATGFLELKGNTLQKFVANKTDTNQVAIRFFGTGDADMFGDRFLDNTLSNTSPWYSSITTPNIGSLQNDSIEYVKSINFNQQPEGEEPQSLLAKAKPIGNNDKDPNVWYRIDDWLDAVERENEFDKSEPPSYDSNQEINQNKQEIWNKAKKLFDEMVEAVYNLMKKYLNGTNLKGLVDQTKGLERQLNGRQDLYQRIRKANEIYVKEAQQKYMEDNNPLMP